MKTKLLLLFLITSLFSQAQVSDFINGLNQPNRLIIDNNIIYVKGVAAPGEIIQIDLNAPSPSANVLFNSLPSSTDPIGIGNITKQGNIIYLSYVNDNTGESTLASFDINNPTVLNDIVSGLGFVPALDLYNGELYFTDEDLSGGGISLKKIDISVSNPPVNTIVSGLTNPQDMEFNGSTLYIGDRDAGSGTGIIYFVDVSLSTPALNSFITNTNVRGVYVYNDFLYFSESGVIKKAPFSNPTNITTEVIDTGGSTDFLRDIVISGTNLYMPQENFGKIVTKEDLTLSTNDFNNQLSDVSIYNNKNDININGLNNQNHNIKIYSLTGSEILSRSMNSNDNSIDISQISNGIYLLNIDNKQTFKFAK
ncbi:Por secretion system C-terminal sorting domain-containing protein [Formosa sp. Hel1_31_208]|uniref:T9SS type A sorting domain-containing protein n=1 Tax=Formosa sp. Hel1_31_208 TaxID=1798225 RepID=UPI00087BAF3F|nr:T9SS type A sorting domain-containing protein [Formosa sp. Hel1_31_208]SDR91256.1 Por secretion system C-terminal sorting domain-containing protein [Formosa sp. Hel1_31_208]